MVDKFFDINLGNIISWLVMGGGFVAFWVKLSDRVDNNKAEIARIENEVRKRFDRQDDVLEEIKMSGSPSSRTAIMVLNSRVEGHGLRVAKLEENFNLLTAVAKDVEWIKYEMQRKKNGVLND